MDNNEKAILKTILYSDIFAYPLTQNEIWLYLISSSSIAKETIAAKLKRMDSIRKIGNYYVIKGREAIAAVRERRIPINQQKMRSATAIASWLFFIPTVFFIGVSGGVAMQNADTHDDIDLFVIVKKDTVWVSRLLLLFFLQCLGVRRKQGESIATNKICLNMIIDEDALSFSKKRQDIYTAHEIVQLVPLFDRYNTYQRFLQQNVWVQHYVVNAYTKKRIYKKGNYQLWEKIGSSCLSLPGTEMVARKLQEWIMKRHKTSEIVTKNMLAFHPFDYRMSTLQRFQEKIKAYV